MLTINGFYKIKQEYFNDFREFGYDTFFKYDRPFYYAIKREHENFYWFIPLSSRVDKVKEDMEKRESLNKPNDIYYICKIFDIENAFKICDITPISDKYIEREYTKFNSHMVLKNQNDIDEINKRANVILNLIDKNLTFTKHQKNYKAIIEKL